MSAACSDLINFTSSPRSTPILIKDLHELRGTLENVQPFEDGLLHIRIAGLDRLIPDELEAKLNALRGRLISVLRVDSFYDAEEVQI